MPIDFIPEGIVESICLSMCALPFQSFFDFAYILMEDFNLVFSAYLLYYI